MNRLAELQHAIYAAIGGHLGAFASSRDWIALLTILPLGIVFGAVHALTPGHSKTLLASYLIGSRLALLRGLAVSTALAATHVLSSVLIALFAGATHDPHARRRRARAARRGRQPRPASC